MICIYIVNILTFLNLGFIAGMFLQNDWLQLGVSSKHDHVL